MHDVNNNLNFIEKKIHQINPDVKIIVVSKTFPMEKIKPLIKNGHKYFGENKVQEAQEKWQDIKSKFPDLKLHMIGKLQTNKVKYVIPLFDYIHSLDNLKLAEKISLEQKKINKNLKIFIQVNIGGEIQKNGISPADLQNFHDKCVNDLNLNIIGLMCIPPQSDNPNLYFKEMLKLKNFIGLQHLSMGMSSDYIEAVKHGSSFVRIGSKIFGNRT